MNTEKNHERAAGMTQTSIAIPTVILERLTREAKAQRRSRNNLIALILEDGVETFERLAMRETNDASPAPVASREPTRYKIGKNRLGTKRSAPPVLKVQPGMDITIR